MFNNPVARFVLRAVLVGVAVAAAKLQGNLPGISGSDAIDAALAAIIASLAYAGIGVAVPQVEPKVGNKLPGA
jgi:hypothetical protein